MKKYLVIGNPIEHSLSPKLHNYWFEKNNIDANYDRRKIDKSEIEKIINEIKDNKLDGINVTVPFKTDVIPFLDILSEESQITQSVNTIYKQDKKIHYHFIKLLKKHLKSSDFILGKSVEIFEKNFSKFTKSKYSIGCANGTDALTIALKSLNLEKNSEVIIPAMTYCSTSFSIFNANLKPILVDTDHMSPTISLKELKKK